MTRRFEWHRRGQLTTPTAPAGYTTPVAWEATGWRYLQVAPGDLVNRSGVSFNDAGWATGRGAFGHLQAGIASFPAPNTTWDLATSLWLRRTIALTAGTPVQIVARVEQAVTLFWNGEQIGAADPGGATVGPFVVPSAQVLASNVLAVRVDDDGVSQAQGGQTYADVQVSAGTPPVVVGEFTTYADVVLANAPLAYYRLGEPSGTTMTDSSGNARPGAYVGTVALNTPGLLTGDANTCASLAGSGHGTVADAAWAHVATASVEAWFTTTQTGAQYLAGWFASGTNATLFLDLAASNVVRVYARIAGTVRTVQATVLGLRDGARHHVVGTYDGTTLRLYVDGVEKATGAWPGALSAATAALTIGKRGDTNSSQLVGKVDEVAVYAGALPPTDVAQHYSVGTTGPIANDPPEPEPEPEPTPPELDGWVVDEDRSQALITWTATHGRSDAVARTGPATCTLQLGTPWSPIAPEIGERFRITLSAAVRTQLGIDTEAAARFSGEVTDCVTDPETRRHTVTGVGRWARSSRYAVDGTSWPAEDDGARLQHVIAATRSAEDAGTIDAGTVTLATPTAPATAATLVDLVSDSTGGQLVEQRTGLLDWHDENHRRGRPVLIELAAGEVFRGFTWAKRVADVANDVTVTTAAGTAVQVVDQAAVDERGPYPLAVSTALTSVSDAESLGSLIVSRRARPAWQLPTVQVDLLRTVLSDARRAILAQLRQGDLIKITGLPPSPDLAARTEMQLFVEGTTEQAYRSTGTHDTPARDAWRLVLAVSDPAASGVSVRWVDVTDDALTWSTVDPDLSWLDVGRITDPADLA